MTYQQLWRRLVPLYDSGEAKAIVRTLLEERFGLSMADILCYDTDGMAESDAVVLEDMLRRLMAAEPVQYVLGEALFMGRRFHVVSGVLIPRPETETLCQWVEETCLNDAPAILDIGSGSGCIAITLALDIPNAQVTAIDISPKALEVTRLNAQALDTHIDVLQKDILSPDDETSSTAAKTYDIIVSNPPYICASESGAMHPNVLQHEPDIALFVPNDDPLLFYKAIARHAHHALRSGGMVFFECNPAYLDATAKMLCQEGFHQVETRDDNYGKKRFCKATLL